MSDALPPTPEWARGHHTSLEYHRVLLDDPVRVDAYERALRALVTPGQVVLDLGCGVGLLAMLAARRGARVHAVEVSDAAHVARALIAHNHLADQITLHHADLATLAPVEPVDLIVSDFMGRLVVDDGMLPLMPYARRWLAPQGRFCPSRVTLHLAPVGALRFHALDLWRRPFLGLDLSPALPHALTYAYHTQLHPQALAADPQTLATLTPPDDPPPIGRDLTFTLTRDTELRGIAGWFVAALAPDVLLSTAPGHETHWGQYLFPLPPTAAQAGDVLEVRVWLEHDQRAQTWRWRGALRRDAQRVMAFDLSSDQDLSAPLPGPTSTEHPSP